MKKQNEKIPSSDGKEASSTTSKGKGIRLLTYNFFLRPPPFCTGGEDWKTERLEYFIKEYLDDYDVICFQECYNLIHDRIRILIEKAKEAGFAYHATAPAPSFFGNHVWDGG